MSESKFSVISKREKDIMIAIVSTPVGGNTRERMREVVRIRIRAKTMNDSSIVTLDGAISKVKLKVKFESLGGPENCIIEITNRFEKKRTLLKKCMTAQLTYSIDYTKIKLDKIATSFYT